MTKEEKIIKKVHELAQEQIREPSKTTKRLTDLQNNGLAGVTSNSSKPESPPAADKSKIP